MMVRKDYRNAMLLAVQLEQPSRLLNLMNEYTKGMTLKESVSHLSGLLRDLPEEAIDKVLNFTKEWNSSLKRAAISQIILNVILALPFNRSKLPSLVDTVKSLLPYSERHFEHVIDLMSNSYLVDFVLSQMENFMN